MFRKLLQKVDFTPAVTWGILVRIWQIVAGAVSFLLLSLYMSPDARGYYVTLWSFIALQTMVDLGFTVAIVNFSSHEWSKLTLTEDGAIDGDRVALGRLIGLGRAAGRWFLSGSFLFVLIAGIPAVVVFAAKGETPVSWQMPLYMTLLWSAVSLLCSPFISLLEGCGQVEQVYRFRFGQAVLTNLGVWVTLVSGGELYAAVAAAGLRAVSEIFFLTIRYRNFFRPFRDRTVSSEFNWSEEFWPVQWRLAVGGVFSYFAYNLFNPVMFHYHSEKLAGQMGMTRQLLVMIQSAAHAWFHVRVPEFGILIAKKQFGRLDQLFRRTMWLSTSALIAAGTGFVTGVYVLNWMGSKYADTLLNPLPTAIMLVGLVLFQFPFGQTLYLRAHKKEPVFLATMASNVSIGLSVWLFGSWFAAEGAVTGYLLSVLLVTVPGIYLVYRKCRTAWHNNE